jgi:hypothetical protein
MARLPSVWLEMLLCEVMRNSPSVLRLDGDASSVEDVGVDIAVRAVVAPGAMMG